MDSDPNCINEVVSRDDFWKHDLAAVAAFITAENVNEIITAASFNGEVGLLSIDVDGMDYWIWEAVTACSPVIVIVEYNSVFGSTHAVTVPYDRGFDRHTAHYSHLYAGASLKALEHLGRRKGYSLVGSNSAGNNAFFVKDEYLADIRPLAAADAYVESRFRESRDSRGYLNYLRGEERLREIADLRVFDVTTNEMVTLSHLHQQTA